MCDLIIVSGSPGSGKTTVARLLAQRYPRCVHLHTDDFWHFIVQGSIPPFMPESEQQNQTVVGVIASAAFGYANGGYTTIVDGVVGPWMLHHYQNAAEQHPNVDLHYVVLRPERETALARAQQRTEPGALLDAAPILDLWQQFNALGDLSRHAVDTTHFDADETAEVVYQELLRNRMRLPSAHQDG